jgi:hypothetical protein
MKPYHLCYLTLLAALFTFGKCNKNSDLDNNTPFKIKIEGFLIMDFSGNPITHWGEPDNDWKVRNTLSSTEMNLFKTPTTEELLNTTQATIDTILWAYPNPLVTSQAYAVKTSDSVLLQMVIVDSSLAVLKRNSIKIKGSPSPATLLLDFSDRTLFPDRKAFRVYFSFSGANKPNYKSGYGDIKICDNAIFVNQCF